MKWKIASDLPISHVIKIITAIGLDGRYVTFAYHSRGWGEEEGRWISGHDDSLLNDKVIAWMDLPEPYSGDDL